MLQLYYKIIADLAIVDAIGQWPGSCLWLRLGYPNLQRMLMPSRSQLSSKESLNGREAFAYGIHGREAVRDLVEFRYRDPPKRLHG